VATAEAGNQEVADVSESENVRREVSLEASPQEVWSALTQAPLLSAWFDTEAELDPRQGGAVRFRSRDGTDRRGVIELFDPPRRLAFRWRLTRALGEPSVVEFALLEDGTGTRLVVTESRGILRPGATLEAMAR
jgi:uncharacterized protein YndB with AHSA1/START domain